MNLSELLQLILSGLNKIGLIVKLPNDVLITLVDNKSFLFENFLMVELMN